MSTNVTLYTIDGSIESLFGYSLVYEDCATIANCSTTQSDMGNCTVQYGQVPSSLGPPINGSLNSSFSLPLESSTQYYFVITFMQNSTIAILRRNFTTGNGLIYINSSNMSYHYSFLRC